MTDLTKFALDLLDELSTRFDDIERWEIVLARLAEVGFNALNMGCFSPQTKELYWVRSSMSAAWLEEYESKGYPEIDPLLAQIYDGTKRRRLYGIAPVPGQITNDKMLMYRQGLAKAGYNHLYSYAVPCPGNEAKLVVLSSHLEEARFWMEECERDLRILATVIATNLGPETDSEHGTLIDAIDVFTSNPQLTPREAEVLSLLAEGLRNDRIAEVLNVSEVTVRTHLRNAREKLKAPTREAALVRALQLNLISPPPHRNR